MHTKVKFHESRRLGFFAASFFLPLFSYSFFLGKTDSYRKLLFSSFFAFPPFFRIGFTRCRVFLLLQRHRKRTIHVNDGDQNNEKRVQFVVSTETELVFFSYD